MVDLAAFVDLFRATGIALAGTTTLAALVSVLLSAGYRTFTTRSPPTGAVPLVAIATVTGYLTVTLATTGQLLEDVPPDHHYSAGYLLSTVVLAGTGAVACSRLGDHVACQIVGLSQIDAEGDTADALRSARLAVACDLPASIDRLAGYRPVDSDALESLAGTTVHLPHGLSASERRDRLERALERATGVDVATVQLGDDGAVQRVSVGRRPTGVGSLLPPETVAVAVRTRHSPAGGLGDPVECWSTGDRKRLVATGTLYAATGSVATVLVDRDRLAEFDAGDRYRLVTTPRDPTDGYALVGTLRTVTETVVAWTVDDDGPLAGEFVGWLPGRVLVVARGNTLLAMPADNETLRPGDRLWMLASPDALAAFDRDRDDVTEPGETDDGTDQIDRHPDREPAAVDAQ